MTAGLVLALLVGSALVTGVVVLREPGDPFAIAVLLAGLTLVAFAPATALFYLGGRARLRRVRAREALRRGALVALAVSALAFLRVLDALTLVTAAFVVAALAALEGVLSARG